MPGRTDVRRCWGNGPHLYHKAFVFFFLRHRRKLVLFVFGDDVSFVVTLLGGFASAQYLKLKILKLKFHSFKLSFTNKNISLRIIESQCDLQNFELT